jgi:hypothetical protein
MTEEIPLASCSECDFCQGQGFPLSKYVKTGCGIHSATYPLHAGGLAFLVLTSMLPSCAVRLIGNCCRNYKTFLPLFQRFSQDSFPFSFILGATILYVLSNSFYMTYTFVFC